MMRLRANTLWPAMHECTVPFHFVKDARETTEKYGIIIGTSHCEPMTRNSAGEWSDQLNGPYNFVTNSNNVIRYWKERLLKVGQKENIYTIGMRGRHDGRMQGVALGRWESILLRKTPSHFTHFNKRGREAVNRYSLPERQGQHCLWSGRYSKRISNSGKSSSWRGSSNSRICGFHHARRTEYH